ncbi:hypothetical protein B0J15DRAFT_553459 [Fusarium solani]|uniref:Uncharacterized protein n=1 Tax=Fusarium solani TaxID=169388 RepID=A0A9P9JWV0_FUSSL|nr:uncharacterized protein B0J15DRAFT_553459 [Fusarium solani]KAH7240597.1 hypothetical protein B0J15DRAFT_553459 [Fusarium solani]
MDVPLRVIIPITITCFAYVLCRFYIYLEDLISLRMQPADVYLTDIFEPLAIWSLDF